MGQCRDTKHLIRVQPPEQLTGGIFLKKIYNHLMLTQLKNIGLSENEARVYVAMLELGPSTVLAISQKSGINRPTTYVQIENLKKSGLASSQEKDGKSLFAAESPDYLKILIEREQKLIEQKKQSVAEILPDLTSMYNLAGNKPVVRYFEGKSGLEKMKEEFLKKSPKEILGISAMDEVLKIFPQQLTTYTPERIKRRIPSRFIYTSEKGHFLKETDKEMMRESKFVSPKDMPFAADITILDDTVAIAALRGKYSGTIIEHPEIADSFRGLFELAWKLIK